MLLNVFVYHTNYMQKNTLTELKINQIITFSFSSFNSCFVLFVTGFFWLPVFLYYLISFIALQETVGKFFQTDIAENALVGIFSILLIADLLVWFLVLYFLFLFPSEWSEFFFFSDHTTNEELNSIGNLKGKEKSLLIPPLRDNCWWHFHLCLCRYIAVSPSQLYTNSIMLTCHSFVSVIDAHTHIVFQCGNIPCFIY